MAQQCYNGRVFTTPDVSLNIPESVLFTDYVKGKSLGFLRDHSSGSSIWFEAITKIISGENIFIFRGKLG